MRWIICLLAALIAALAMFGCDDVKPRTGSAQGVAADAQARATAAATATDQAGKTAADLLGDAAAAEAMARATGAQRDIDAAVAARVRAAAAQAVFRALRDQEAAAQAAAAAAVTRAQAERQAEQAAQDDRAWRRLCRIIGLAGIVGGILIGGAIGWLAERPRMGVGIALLLGLAGAACIAIGPATAWMPWIVGAAAVAALSWWALSHKADRRRAAVLHQAATAGSRAIDAVEHEITEKAAAAKKAFGDTLAAAGLKAEIEARRGPSRDWSTP